MYLQNAMNLRKSLEHVLKRLRLDENDIAKCIHFKTCTPETFGVVVSLGDSAPNKAPVTFSWKVLYLIPWISFCLIQIL